MFALRIHTVDNTSTQPPLTAIAGGASNRNSKKNLFIEFKGVVRLFRNLPLTSSYSTNPPIVFIVAVPNYLSPQEFVAFCGNHVHEFSHLSFIRNDAVEDRYSVLIKLVNQAAADGFSIVYKGKRFSPSKTEVCHIYFAQQVEYTDSLEEASNPQPGYTELPSCPVCLERLDYDTSAIQITHCDHSFQCPCISKLTFLSCRVCRLFQQHGQDGKPSCAVCGSSRNSWVCLICGFIGCGRYVKGHAIEHYRHSQHCYSFNQETQHIWDYVGEKYVHREPVLEAVFEDLNCYKCGEDGHVGEDCPRCEEASEDEDDGAGTSHIGAEGYSHDGGDDPPDEERGEGEGSEDTLLETEAPKSYDEELSPEFADVTYVPGWSVLCKHTTRDPDTCREMLNHFSTPQEVLRWRNMKDGALERRYNVLLAQLAAVGSEVRSRWSTKSTDCGRIRDSLRKRTDQLKNKDIRIGELQADLQAEKDKRAQNFRKYEAGVRDITSLNQQVETLKKQNAELTTQNKVLEEKASTPNVPPGTVLILQVELDRLTNSLKRAERDARFSSDLLIYKEGASSSTAIQSLNETNRSLVEQKTKLFEDRSWLIEEGIKEFVDRLHDSREFLGPLGEVCQAANATGFTEGVQAGYRNSRLKTPMALVPHFDNAAGQKYDEALVRFSHIGFPYLDTLASASELSLEEIRKIYPAALSED